MGDFFLWWSFQANLSEVLKQIKFMEKLKLHCDDTVRISSKSVKIRFKTISSINQLNLYDYSFQNLTYMMKKKLTWYLRGNVFFYSQSPHRN